MRPRSKLATSGWMTVAAAVLALAGVVCEAQTLRYTAHREQAIPDYATFELGPFMSALTFSQSFGYRYVDYQGQGSDLILENELGDVIKEGSDFPLVSTIFSRNYCTISPNWDLELSFRASYYWYPLGTSENDFDFTSVDPGLIASFGGFTFRVSQDEWYAGYGSDRVNVYAANDRAAAFANLSTEFAITKDLKMRVYEQPAYHIDYIDSRGRIDTYSGRKYEYFQNLFGADLDWVIADDKNAYLSVSRLDTIPTDTQDFDYQREVAYTEMLGYEQQLGKSLVGGVKGVWEEHSYPDSDRGDILIQRYLGYTSAQVTKASRVGASAGVGNASISSAGAYEQNGDYSTPIGSFFLETEITDRIKHSFDFTRDIRSGYQEAVESYDRCNYRITWMGRAVALGYMTAYENVKPELTTVAGYSDWLHQVNVFYPLTQLLSLSLVTSYDLRHNDGGTIVSTDEVDQALLSNDYDTWVTRLGTGYHLTKNWTLSGYIEHAQRFSDNPDLEWVRNMLAITATFTCDLFAGRE